MTNCDDTIKLQIPATEIKRITDHAWVENFSAIGRDAIVTDEVLAAAFPCNAHSLTLDDLGIYAGPVVNATDIKRVLIFPHYDGSTLATDEAQLSIDATPVVDDAGNEVYGVLTENNGAFTLSYKHLDGKPYTFVEPTKIDFAFIVIKPAKQHISLDEIYHGVLK